MTTVIIAGIGMDDPEEHNYEEMDVIDQRTRGLLSLP